MTGKLVLANLKHKPMRSLLSALLIGVPVTLILSLVGLSHGLLGDAAKRSRGVGADIFLRPPGSSLMSLSGAPLREALIPKLQAVPHVAIATGMITYPYSGLTYVNGVDFPAFEKLSGNFRFIQGGPIQADDEVIVDDYFARQNNLTIGSPMTVANRKWRVAGIFENGKLSHIIVRLKVLQDLTSNSKGISQVFIKADKPENIPVVIAELKELLPGYPTYTGEELASLYSIDNMPGLRPFINVMIGLGIVVGLAVVCLSMYMAVLQRTREIGILKSLGASKGFILELILIEAMIMAIGGTILGIVFNIATSNLMMKLAPASATMVVVPSWWPIALLITMTGAFFGALYPGLNAAQQDPIEALSYE